MTFACPLCGSQLVVRLLLPTPEHRDIKPVKVISVECPTADCGPNDDYVRGLLHIQPVDLDSALRRDSAPAFETLPTPLGGELV
jgi:hypothetical protein